MAPLGYVEILDGKGKVMERHGVEAFPVSVGRAYTNQIIIDDPFVCPMHLSLAPDEQGRLVARDLGSVNGLRDSARGQLVTSMEIDSGTQFRIGHTILRYRSVDYPTAPTTVDRIEKASRLASPYAAVAAGSIVLMVLLAESFLSSSARVTAINIISEPVPIIATMLGWAGLWALASRLIVNRFNFGPHLTIVCAAFLTTTLLGIVSEWSEFFFPAIPVLWLAGLLVYGWIFAGLVYGHLVFASALRRRTRLLAALALSAAVVGTNTIAYFAARSKFTTVMEYTGVLKPIDAAWVPTISVNQFIGASETLKGKLDLLAQKANASQP